MHFSVRQKIIPVQCDIDTRLIIIHHFSLYYCYIEYKKNNWQLTNLILEEILNLRIIAALLLIRCWLVGNFYVAPFRITVQMQNARHYSPEILLSLLQSHKMFVCIVVITGLRIVLIYSCNRISKSLPLNLQSIPRQTFFQSAGNASNGESLSVLKT